MDQNQHRRSRRCISLTDKQRIVDAYLDPTRDYVEVASALGIPRGTAWSIVMRYRNEGAVIERRRGGQRPRLVDDEMLECLIARVAEAPTLTLEQLNADLRNQIPHKPRVSISTLHRALDARFISLKKLEAVPAERNRQDVKDGRKDLAEWFLGDGDAQEVIFIDESGYNLWISRTRGRAPRGQRCVRVVGARAGPNFTLVIAVSNTRGLLHSETVQGGFNSERFNTFLTRASEAAGMQRATFIFDNAPCHRRAREANLFALHQFRFLPPYSPFLNLAENAFSAWKAAVKRNMEEVRDEMLQQRHQQRLATLAQISAQNLTAITPELCHTSWRKMRLLIPRCLRLEDIFQEHA